MKEPHATFERAWQELRLKQDVNKAAWGLGDFDRWDIDDDDGLIVFSNADGSKAIAEVQTVGSYNSDERTWMWAWDNPSISYEQARPAHLARHFGQQHGLADYTTGLIACAEDPGWMFTAVALHLVEAAGAYRGPSGARYFYMTFGKVTVFPAR